MTSSRICLHFNNNYYDISNVEFKKDGNSSQSIREGEGKVLVEEKTIFNGLFQIHNCNLDKARKIKVLVAQICGLQGIVRSVGPSLYTVLQAQQL